MRAKARGEMTGRLLVAIVAVALATVVGGVAWAQSGDPLDPAHNLALPCSSVSTPGSVPRAARNMFHLANACGFVGTDVEFQSRLADDGLHDYAFVGTMGEGLKIFDVTDPRQPRSAGQYTDPGWQNDVQVRGNLAVIGFDPLTSGIDPSTSACLQDKGASGGVDLVRLEYDRVAARFATHLLGCVSASPSGGAHNSTIHPSGEWLAMINPRTHGSVDVVDLRSAQPFRKFRIVQSASLGNAACSGAATGQCIPNGRAGTWSTHDVHFSKDGRTMYVAAVGNDTVLVDVRNVLSGSVKTIGVAPNDSPPTGDVSSNPHDVSISHQSDVTADGDVLVVTDERGGGTSETRCNTEPSGMIGGMHFWALDRLAGVPASLGASPAVPKRIGGWFYPDPTVLPDPLATQLASRGRAERACTIHVFRLGGNGTSSPGAAQKGYDGVSSLGRREAVSAHYGAGVWHIDFSRARSDTDGVVESPFTTWGNTLGWNVMPGAETWSAKEYKGFVYAGDMVRGFDVYGLGACEGLACVDLVPDLCVGAGDRDGDGLTDELEELFGANADDPDSDADGVRDGNEDSDDDGEDDEDEDDPSDTCAQDSDADGTDDEDEDD